MLGMAAPRRHLGNRSHRAHTMAALPPKVALQLQGFCEAAKCRDHMPPHVDQVAAATAPWTGLLGAPWFSRRLCKLAVADAREQADTTARTATPWYKDQG